MEDIFSLALEHHQKRNFDEAKKLYKKLLEEQPNHLDAYNNLGIIFKNSGEYENAKFCYEKAIEINPNYPEAHNNLGIIFNNLGKYHEAKTCYEKAIEIKFNYSDAHNNLGIIFKNLGEYEKAKACYEKAIEINSKNSLAASNLTNLLVIMGDNKKAIYYSNKSLKLFQSQSKFINQQIPLYRLKHDVQQAEYLHLKSYKITGIEEFKSVGSQILTKNKNENYEKKILLDKKEIYSLLPFYNSNYVYELSNIPKSCLNPNKDWLEVENQYFGSPKQIIYIDDFLSNEALEEIRKFCLVSKIWVKEYDNKYLGAFGHMGFIGPIHLKIASELKKKLPKLFGPHDLNQFWSFKYDTNIGKGKGTNIHADFALVNLNFWITPDEFNKNKNTGGLKVYDAAAPQDWTFYNYNTNSNKIYKFLNENNASCINVPYRCNRAVLFNSSYFHETDQINFMEGYESRRINITYLFGNRLLK